MRATMVALVLVSVLGCESKTPGPTPIPALTISCPPRTDTQSPDGEPVAVSFPPPQTTGGTAPISVSCEPPSGPFPVGSTTVTCRATDARGQTATCNFVVAVQGPPRLRYTRFLAFGDSLTAGTVSVGPTFLLIVAPQSYPAQLEKRLTMKYRFQERPIVLNDGVPGEFTPDGLRRLRGSLQQHRPEVVLLMEGSNDLLNTVDGPGIALENLRRMIGEAKSLNVQVALATIPPQRAGGLRRRDAVAAIIPGFNDRVRELATAESVVLVDVFAGMKDDLSLIGIDDLHPTERGYDVMAGIFAEAIERGFEERPEGFRRISR